jgi:hypothetical protein
MSSFPLAPELESRNLTMNALEDTAQPTELQMLKSRADMMGITYSNNIGLDALRKKVDARMNGLDEPAADAAVDTAADPQQTFAPNPLAGQTEPVKRKTLRQHLHDEQMKLVRLRITNLDPKKKDLPGEIFTVANEHLGTVRKFIPYGEVTDNGYHVPYIIYKQLESRRFHNIRTVKDRRTGTNRVESSWVKEFALEVLPTLTKEEIGRLATAQIAAGSIESAAS